MWKWFLNWIMGGDWKSFKVYSKNINIKGESGKVSDGNENHGIGNRRKNNPCHKLAKNLDEKYSSVLWEVEFASDESKFLAEYITKQNLEK